MSSAYNPKASHDDEEHQGVGCAANGCPLAGTSKLAGKDWLCCYHAKVDSSLWRVVTLELNHHVRLQQIVAAAESITIAEFEHIQASGKWALSELIIPVPNECHAHWVHRIKQTVHKTLKSKLNAAIARTRTVASTGKPKQSVSKAVSDLTSGALLRNPTTQHQHEAAP